jgi:hypothetical protein
MKCPFCGDDSPSNEKELLRHVSECHPEEFRSEVSLPSPENLARSMVKVHRQIEISMLAAHLADIVAKSGRTREEVLADFQFFLHKLDEGLL